MTLVVGAAVFRHGTLLAARRTRPAEAAGRWELPGGKVHPGESPDSALVREIAEELGCDVAVERWLEGEQAIGDTHVLRAAICSLRAGEPQAGVDHDGPERGLRAPPDRTAGQLAAFVTRLPGVEAALTRA